MHRKLRFGILGTGNIAAQFAAGVAKAERSEVTAVGSRSRESADAFAGKWNIIGRHASYDTLLADPNVDAIYNSLPNTMHHEWTLKALASGKHVLCEKPFALDIFQSQEMFDAADRAGLVLMEAFMYRSHPLTHAVVKAVRDGEIGAVQAIRSSFCYRTNRIDGNIRFDQSLAGGALMDIGCYCINFSRLIAGAEPITVQAVGKLHETGVDEQAAGTLLFSGGVVANFVCGMRAQANNMALILGEDGYIEIPIPWKPPTKAAEFTIARGIPPKQDLKPGAPIQQPRRTIQIDSPGELYGMEADDFARTVLDGAPIPVTKADTLGNMRVLDEMRRQVSLRP